MTDTTTKMACSLDTEALTNRRAFFRERIMPKALARTRTDDGLQIVFENDPAVRDELRLFIALERQCCGFLDFELSEDLEKSRLLLVVLGPLEAHGVLDQMESIFIDSDDVRPTVRARHRRP